MLSTVQIFYCIFAINSILLFLDIIGIEHEKMRLTIFMVIVRCEWFICKDGNGFDFSGTVSSDE
ncbi:hypothetical protein FACS189415_2500 [Bacteroidia bacterium]|nr:hypothetical protein FACS189426_04690 [Bacteroidia bacterium]GHU82298.1 hypothetical protein FACS189415_2500 [Bacteroidia bacterium]